MEKVILESFEGPLDLLLHLIKEHKVNIYDIPIFTITKQYLEYLNKMSEYNIEIASEFLVLASTLVSIKVKMLLPKDNEEEQIEADDPRMELVNRLLEYERYKEASETFLYLLSTQGKSYYRPQDEKLYNKISKESNSLENTEVSDLTKYIQFALERKKEQQMPPYEVKNKQISISQKISELLIKLGSLKQTYFEKIVDRNKPGDVVISFMAILDLYKQNKVELNQMDSFTPIKITYKEGKIDAI